MASEAKLVGAPPIPAIDVERARRKPANRAATLRSFVVTFFAVVVLAAFLSPMLRTVTTALKSTDQITQAGVAAVAGRLRDVRVRGRDLRRLPRPDAGRHDARPGAGRRRAGRRAQFDRPGEPRGGAHHVGGLMAGARVVVGARAEVVELRGRLGDHRLPATAVQHRGAGRDRHHRHPPVVRRGRLRLRALPVPGTKPALPAAAVDDLPAGGRHPDPDLHDLRQARMGRHVAAAAGARLLRERVRRLPAAPVLPHAAARAGRRGQDRRRRAVQDPDRRSSFRSRGR